MIAELCRGGLPRIVRNRNGGKIGGVTRAEARACGMSHKGQEPGSRPTPEITRCRTRAGWGCERPELSNRQRPEHPAIHFTHGLSRDRDRWLSFVPMPLLVKKHDGSKDGWSIVTVPTHLPVTSSNRPLVGIVRA
jgi:hypothetical protein